MGIPTSLEMLTAPFLSQALGEDARSVAILDSHIGNGLTGSIARIGLEYGTESAHLPKTVIAKFSSFDDRARGICNWLGFYEREVRFYRQIAGTIDLRTPHCYYAAYDPAQVRSLLLLEDLSGYALESWPKGCSIARAGQAVREIARLHAAWWNRPGLNDIPWLYHELPGLGDEFARQWDGFRVCMQLSDASSAESPDILRLGERIQQELDAVAEALFAPPITLVHGDYQLDNLAFGSSGGSQEVAVLDWAFVMAAKGVADLAYFLVGNLAPAVRRTEERTFIDEYLAALAQAGVVGYTPAQCFQDYQKAILYYFVRLVIAVGKMAITEGSAGKAIDSHAFDFWSPIVNRFLIALQEHYAIQ